MFLCIVFRFKEEQQILVDRSYVFWLYFCLINRSIAFIPFRFSWAGVRLRLFIHWFHFSLVMLSFRRCVSLRFGLCVCLPKGVPPSSDQSICIRFRCWFLPTYFCVFRFLFCLHRQQRRQKTTDGHEYASHSNFISFAVWFIVLIWVLLHVSFAHSASARHFIYCLITEAWPSLHFLFSTIFALFFLHSPSNITIISQ